MRGLKRAYRRMHMLCKTESVALRDNFPQMAFGTVSATDPEMCTFFNPPHPNRDTASSENGEQGLAARRGALLG